MHRGSPLATTKEHIPLSEKGLEKSVSSKLKTCQLVISLMYIAITILHVLLVPLITIQGDEIKTSVGQPTTLHVTVAGNPMPEVSWSKDGEPINHLILEDNSLYIRNTTQNDQGCYTVTATNSGGKSSKTVQLVVLYPQFVPCKLHR